MASIIAYLENYVESTIGLPSDLARFLNMIRVLDERATELEAALRQTTEALCSLNPVGTRPQAPENKEYQDLVSQFKRQEQLLYQFCEEKVTLAHHALDLIQTHQRELEATKQQFDDEVNAVPVAAGDQYNPFESTYAAGGARGKGKGLTDWDSLEPLQAPTLKARVPSQGPGGHKKRVREDQRTLAASVLSQADDFSGMGGMGGFGGGGGGNSNPGSMQAGGDAPPMYPPLQFMNHERTAGLLDSAQQPQLPGRLLQVSDIRPELQGRQAEMYWPDDNMWYLIEIHTVNVVNKTAMIVYRTGEVEELNLSEIANEGHMSLIEM